MGSEMCIRDRFVSATFRHRFAISDRVPAGQPAWVDGKDYLANICLLYTSDAADERSSVDLGGRRIIKKKITHPHKRLQGVKIYKSHIGSSS